MESLQRYLDGEILTFNPATAVLEEVPKNGEGGKFTETNRTNYLRGSETRKDMIRYRFHSQYKIIAKIQHERMPITRVTIKNINKENHARYCELFRRR